jgi:iron complex outermembrane receptor protein
MTNKERLLRSTVLAGVAALTMGGAPVFAQQAGEPEQTSQEEESEADSSDRVVITGSRIRRDEFSSIKPVQIISGEVARDVGLFSATEMIQESTVATGLQIDATFIGFVSDNGPGATNIDLRGLGPQRTLVLVNGRRIGAAGSEGAPNVPDLSLIPSSLIERVDLLLDGASSVYGSDAVAGVVNAILRNDFDGFEVEASTTLPEQSGGEITTLSARWGVNGDRGFMGFGAEYQIQENLRRDQRDYFGDCQTPVEITSTGEIRTNNANAARLSPTSDLTDCNLAFGINRIWLDPLPGEFATFFGSLYYTPGSTNVGIPNFSESTLFGTNDLNGDGVEDVPIINDFWQFSDDEQARVADILSEREQMSAFTYGEYNLGGMFDTTAFFEAGFANRQTRLGQNGSQSLSVTVAADNPFNPCNPNGVNGFDCGAAFTQQVINLFGVPLSGFGLPDPVPGARPAETNARVNLAEEDRYITSEVTQMRFVGGFRGVLPDPDFLPLRNLTWEVSASYDRSNGSTRRPVWDENRITLAALTTIEDPSNPGQFVCGLDADGDGIPDSNTDVLPNGSNATPECLPVNFFSPTLWQDGGGNFATQEEYDYLRAYRDFNTTVEQTLVQAVFTGDLFDLPAGTVGGVLGFEYREDSIDSDPADTTRQGNAFGFFSDLGANGTRDLFEAFYEVEIPLIAQQPFIEELTINHSGRYTEESNFGNAFTYGVSGVYRPNNWLTARGTYGTSYRAPNLQEQFVVGISGFLGNSDPCLVPDAAFDGINGYDPSQDTREQTVLDNCVAAGVDPTTLGGGVGQPSIEVFTIGNNALTEETSTSWNAGIVFEQPWIDAFDLQFSATYYNIEVEDTLVRTALGTVLDECYESNPALDTNGDGIPDAQISPFCGLVSRGATGIITEVDLPFANQDSETAVGVDYNLVVTRDWELFDRNFTTGLDIRANNTLERDSIVRIPGGDPVLTENLGFEFYPEWNGTLRLFADYDDFRLTWNTRWTGSTDDGDETEEFTDGDTDTCNAGDGLLCKDLEEIDDHFVHTVSLRYSADTWTISAGVSNVFDEEPALVDPGENFELSGTNRFSGHDFLGRRVFVNLRKSF